MIGWIKNIFFPIIPIVGEKYVEILTEWSNPKTIDEIYNEIEIVDISINGKYALYNYTFLHGKKYESKCYLSIPFSCLHNNYRLKQE